jgi:hypothetical protein
MKEKNKEGVEEIIKDSNWKDDFWLKFKLLPINGLNFRDITDWIQNLIINKQKEAYLAGISEEQSRWMKQIGKKIAIHRQLESEYVGSINEIKFGIKRNNPHTFVIEQLKDLLPPM